MAEGKVITAQFFTTERGSEPVREWLMDLPRLDRRTIGYDVKTVEEGWPVGMPTCRAMGKGLWEVRSNLPSGRIARILFCIDNGHMVLLHGFIKKTRQTPQDDLDLANERRRML